MHRAEHAPLRRAGLVLAIVAAAFLAAHVLELPRTLEDLDSINFALGVRDFDLTRYQPHPPGFPVFIALSKVSTWAWRAAGLSSPEPRGLAIWGALGGALAAFALFAVFRRLEGRDRLALAATLVTMCAPLYWFSANRPLTDMTGLAAVLFAQALAVMAWARQRDVSCDSASVRRMVLAAAAVAGVVIGVRAQTFVLTLPLLTIVLFDPRVSSARRIPVRAFAAFVAGVLVWAIPLLIASGGPVAYLAELRHQGAEDFSQAVMLWTHPNIRVAAYALRDTFVLPWATVPLAAVVLTLAVAGAVVLAWRSREALLLVAACTLPYVVFHVLFQEAIHGKYSLPPIPATAYLAVVAIDALSRRLLPLAVAALVAVSLWISAPALYKYSAAPAPVFQALSDMRARATAEGTSPALVTHWESKRAAEWLGPELFGPQLPIKRSFEWRAAVQYWLDGGRQPVWFLVRPGRTDLALIDPVRRTLTGQYRWGFDGRVFTGGARPGGVDWQSVTSPGWFLDTGWALTPEIAGVTHAAHLGPQVQPSAGYLARRPGATFLMIGGRHLGRGSDPPVHLRVEIDGREILAWDQPAGFFLKMLPLPAGTLAGPGPFARLAVTSTNPGAPVEVGLEQFDLQDADAVVWGYADGWQEAEYNPVTEKSWRWTGKTSTLEVHAPGRDVRVRVRGRSPLVDFATAPRVVIRAGDLVVGTFTPDRDFSEEFTVPAAALAAANGRIVIETDRTFAPDDVSHNGDRRQLGLMIYDVTIR